MPEEIDTNDAETELPEIEDGDSTDWEAEAKKYHRIASQRGKKLGELDKLRGEYDEYKKSHPDTPKEQPLKQDKGQQSDPELLTRITGLALQVAGITREKEVELFNRWKQDTGRKDEEIIQSTIFQAELKKVRDDESNASATANIKGGGQGASSNADPDHWTALGRPPTRQEVPNRKEYAAIIRKFAENARTGGKKYWNE